ncbi:MAG TPA: PPOX class F420-dependent oxidoreductase [Nocardioidaceae bacterium]|nr:PPOX class F420-dependent oxidoreductase [Nocardioidaceae bacterium]
MDPISGELLAFWQERHLCTVTTLRADGSPHTVPMGVVLDAQRGQAWAITSGRSQKVRNLRRGGDPRVSVCQVDGRRWSALEGTAEVLDDLASVAEAERRYAERYKVPRANPERVALRITLTGLLGNVR